MARFLQDTDYDVLIRAEIKSLLSENDGTVNQNKILQAESMAVAQIKNYLFGKYDVEQIFNATGTGRNQHIIMTLIDMALYHLYSSISPDKIPEHRSNRYQDAIEWLKDVAKGNILADLPRRIDTDGQPKLGIKISSKHPPEDNRW